MNEQEAPKIEFPCPDYLIKVVGDEHPDLRHFVAGVLVKYDETVTHKSFSSRPSKNGRFVSLNVKMRIEHKDHLSALFNELKVNPLIKIVI